jgi:ribosomal 50S subunit-associated protein YjgA (DUF615 family)
MKFLAAASSRIFLAAVLLMLTSCKREPTTEQEKIAEALRILKRTEVWRDDVKRVQADALRTLHNYAPHSDEVVTALLDVLHRPGTVQMHCEAIATLEKIGPFARKALDALFQIILNTQPDDMPPAFSPRKAAISAIAAIAPTDQRVLTVLFLQLSGPESDARTVTHVLSEHAALYDELIQERVIKTMNLASALNPELIRVAGKIQSDNPRTIEFLLKCLRDQDVEAKCAVVDLLSERDGNLERFVPSLKNLLTELNSDRLPTSLPTDPFGRMVGWHWREAQRKTIAVLGKIGPPASEAAPVITEFLAKQELELRLEAMIALCRINPEASASEGLLNELFDPETQAKSGFRRTHLTNIVTECPAALPIVTSLLKDPRKQVRYSALIALINAGTNAVTALPQVRPLLDDPAYSVRLEATNAIAVLRSPSDKR